MLFHGRVHSYTPTHPDWGNLDMPIYLMCTSLGCGKKLDYPEEIRTDMGRTCKLHTDSRHGWKTIFSQCYSEKTLFENLLYISVFLVECTNESPGDIIKKKVANWTGLGWSLRSCISHRLPVNAYCIGNVDQSRITLKNIKQ